MNFVAQSFMAWTSADTHAVISLDYLLSPWVRAAYHIPFEPRQVETFVL
jgi:hypothetical protein